MNLQKSNGKAEIELFAAITPSLRRMSEKKNEFIVSIADQIVVGFANPGGQLEKLLKDRMYISL